MPSKKAAPSKKVVQPQRVQTRQVANSSAGAGSRVRDAPQETCAKKKGANSRHGSRPAPTMGGSGGSQVASAGQKRASRGNANFVQDPEVPVAGPSRDVQASNTAILQGITQTLVQLTQRVEQLGAHPVETEQVATAGEGLRRQRSPGESGTSSDSDEGESGRDIRSR